MSQIIVACGGRDLIISGLDCARSMLAVVPGCDVHLLIHGNAKGADAAIAEAAYQLGWPCIGISADWLKHGKAAGPIRNGQLLQLAIEKAEILQINAIAKARAEMPWAVPSGALSPGAVSPVASSVHSLAQITVIAFPGGKGTADLVRQAQKLCNRSPVPIVIRHISAPLVHALTPQGQTPQGQTPKGQTPALAK
jgi:predicted Rossmann-fold nucleotide-binding protein